MHVNIHYTSILFLSILIGCQSNEENNGTDSPVIEFTNSEEIDTVVSETQSIVPEFVAEYEKADYQEYYENGQLKIEGNYNGNEQRHGRWVSYYDNGQKWSESNYKDGIKNGHSITFYPNGNVRYVGEYSADEKSGNWTFYDEEGQVVNEEAY